MGSYNVRVANAPAGYFVTEVGNCDKKGIIIYFLKTLRQSCKELTRSYSDCNAPLKELFQQLGTQREGKEQNFMLCIYSPHGLKFSPKELSQNTRFSKYINYYHAR